MSVEYGEVIGHMTCPACGRDDLEIKVRQSGNVGYFCKSIVGKTTNKKGNIVDEYCYTRGNVGTVGSQKLIKQYLETKEDEKDVEFKNENEISRAEQSATIDIAEEITNPAPQIERAVDREPSTEPIDSGKPKGTIIGRIFSGETAFD